MKKAELLIDAAARASTLKFLPMKAIVTKVMTDVRRKFPAKGPASSACMRASYRQELVSSVYWLNIWVHRGTSWPSMRTQSPVVLAWRPRPQQIV